MPLVAQEGIIKGNLSFIKALAFELYVQTLSKRSAECNTLFLAAFAPFLSIQKGRVCAAPAQRLDFVVS